MQCFDNAKGSRIVEAMIAAIQFNKDYLSEVDGLIGDGDHGMNMNKGFTLCKERMDKQKFSFSEALKCLGEVLFNEIGGSMGPIYGTIFMSMADVEADYVGGAELDNMLGLAIESLKEIIQAEVGDKTLIDTLVPAYQSYHKSWKNGADFNTALNALAEAAEEGKESTRELVAKYGRSSRLGERSRGVLDAGAVSCNIILQAMVKEIQHLIKV